MRRGEIWWADAEPGGRRPVLILTRETVLPLLTQITVAPATRRIRGVPTEVHLDERDGMPKECVVSLDSLRTLPKRLLRRRITTLPTARMEQVCEALRYALGC